jgi:hypothetical protein
MVAMPRFIAIALLTATCDAPGGRADRAPPSAGHTSDNDGLDRSRTREKRPADEPPDVPGSVVPAEAVTLPSIEPGSVKAVPGPWYCIKSLEFENMSTCFKPEDACEVGREKLVAGNLRYTGCLPQTHASCFTFHSKLDDRTSFDCSATIAACERQRKHGIERMTLDVEAVRGCTTWNSLVEPGPAKLTAAERPRVEAAQKRVRALFCSDMSAEGRVLDRYFCRTTMEECSAGAETVEASAERAYRNLDREVNVTMGTCRRSTRSAFCTRLDADYLCSGHMEVCQAAVTEGLRSGKAEKASRCRKWRPGLGI